MNSSAHVRAEGERVAYAWDETLEGWYVNDRRRLELGAGADGVRRPS